MNPTVKAPSLGIDLGGSSVKFAWFDAAGACVSTGTRPFDASNPMEWIDRIRELMAEIPSGLDALQLRVGVSAPGLAAPDGRRIASMPGRLAGLVGLDWTEALGARASVPVLNDAHAALLGECWRGAGRGKRNLVLLTLGTGVGGAVMVDGRLLKGRQGKAGHLGHVALEVDAAPDICGIPGSLEQQIGNCTIRERTQGRFETTHQLMEASAAGDAEARAIWMRSIHYLACAVASFINVADPERVIVGGGIARAGELLFGPLRERVRAMEWIPLGDGAEIVPAELGEYAGACGAAWNALGGGVG